MIQATVARTHAPVVEVTHVQGGGVRHLADLTPDEARALADELIYAAQMCEATCARPTCTSHPVAHGMCADHD